MSVLEDVFREEYRRLERMKSAMENELKTLPKGYISTKMINGHTYHYLQKREGRTVTGKIIRAQDLPSLQSDIERRRNLQSSIKEVKRNLVKLERVLK